MEWLNSMSPGKETEECTKLRTKLAELEAELLRQAELLRASEQRFEVLADAAPMMIWLSGVDGLSYYFNRTWLEFRGRTIAEEASSGWTDGLHPEDRDGCLETYLKQISERQPFRIQYRLRRADGEVSAFVVGSQG